MAKKKKYDYLPRVRHTWKFDPTERIVPSHKQYKRDRIDYSKKMEDYQMSSELDDLYPTREEEEQKAYEEMWNNLNSYDAWMTELGLGIDDLGIDDDVSESASESASESELDD